jgi:chromate transporter
VALGPLRLEVPDPGTVLPVALAIAVAALVMIFGLRWSVPRPPGR